MLKYSHTQIDTDAEVRNLIIGLKTIQHMQNKKAKLVVRKCQCLFRAFLRSFSPKPAFSLDFSTPDYVDGGHSANKALLFL